VPLRAACAGGPIPLDDEYADVDEDSDDVAAEEPRKRKVVRYSDFVFTSKLRTLISQLTKVRKKDPLGEITFISVMLALI